MATTGQEVEYQLTGMAGHTLEIVRHLGGYCRLGLCRAACGTYVYAMEPQSDDEEAELPTHLARIFPIGSISVGRLAEEWSSFRGDVLAWSVERRAIFTRQSACGRGRYVCGPESQSDRVLASAINMRDKIAQAVDCEPASLEIEIDTLDGEFSCGFDLSAFDLDAVTVAYNAALNAWAVEHTAEVVD